MDIFNYLFSLGIISLIYTTIFHLIVRIPIVVYESFVLRKTSDEIKYNPSRGHIISDYIHVGLVGTITTFAYQNVEDDLMIFFINVLGDYISFYS